MTDEAYFLLYEKQQAGVATPAEQARLAEYLATSTLPDLPWDAARMGPEAAVQAAIWRQLRWQVQAPKRRRASAVLLLVVLAALGLGYIGYEKWTASQQPMLVQQSALRQKLVPGHNQAVLTLANGATVVLDHAQRGLLARQGGSRVLKTADGRLRYLATELAAEVLYNTVATPRGGQYQLTLPDGSRVWLNAASSLRFPVAFRGSERRVELTGEAYFEVAKDAKRPFRVTARSAEVTVLGTHFNVNAYADEPLLTTTLLEGAVRLGRGAQQALLRPGQQGQLQPNGNWQVVPVDTQRAVAWKNGYFVFDDEPIEAIMRQVGRWYDVEIRYQGALANKNFRGSISRYKDATAVLRMLELTGAVHFTAQGRRITVQP